MVNLRGFILETNNFRNPSLEERLKVTFVSGDNSLTSIIGESLKRKFQLNILPQKRFRIPDRPSDIYLLDLQNGENPLDKVYKIKAIRPESAVVVLMTQSQGDQEISGLFGRAKKQGLIDIQEKPDPSQLVESRYTNDVTELASKLPKHLYGVYTANGRLKNTYIVKIGGSIFDLYKAKPDILHKLLAAIVEMHKHHKVVLTVGGGPAQSMAVDFKKVLGLSDTTYEELSRGQLTNQATILSDLLRQINPDIVAPIPLEYMEFVMTRGLITGDYLEKKIPIISLVPEIPELGIPRMPSSASDLHTVALAEYFHCAKVFFVKDTDGIYRRDPNIPNEFVREMGLPKSNFFIRFVYADQITTSISRIGLSPERTVTDGHLIETSAIDAFLKSKYPHTIQVVNGRNPNKLSEAMDGYKVGSYILKPYLPR